MDAAQTGEMRSAVRRFLPAGLRFALGVALIAWLARSRAIDPQMFRRLLAAWPASLAAMLVFLLDLALMAWRLCLLLRPQGMRLAYGKSVQLTLLSSFFAMFLPGRAGGDLARCFYTLKNNIARRTEIVTVMLFDRALGLFSLLILPLFFAPFFPQLLRQRAMSALLMTSAALALGMLTAFLCCLFLPFAAFRRIGWLGRFSERRPLAGQILRTIRTYRFSAGTLAGTVGIALADNLMVVAVIALALWAVNPSSLSPKLCLVVSMGEIVNSLPITPGGIGVGETAFDALFRTVGLSGGAEALICWRIWNVAVSLLGLPLYLRGFRVGILETARAEAAR